MTAQVDVLAVLDATILAAEADARMYKLDDAAKAVAVFKATRAAVAALIAERDALRTKLEQQPESVRYPSYDALLLIAQSVAGALECAGLTDCDDPGEAIDVIRERLERRISELETAPQQPAPVAGDAMADVLAALKDARTFVTHAHCQIAAPIGTLEKYDAATAAVNELIEVAAQIKARLDARRAKAFAERGGWQWHSREDEGDYERLCAALARAQGVQS